MTALFDTGGSASTDRKSILSSFGTLGNDATNDTAQGQAATGDALGYFKKAASGNPTAQAEAIAPTLNAVAGQNEQQKQALDALGTARGGGVNAAQQQTGDAATKATTTALTDIAPQAAQNEAGIGANLSSLGEHAAGTLGEEALGARKQDLAQRDKVANSIVHTIAQVASVIPGLSQLSSAFGGASGGGGSD